MSELTLAVPKGRSLRALVPLLARAGIDASALLDEERTLVRELMSGAMRCLLLKPDDVPTYVEYGAADLGICGRDVLLERGGELYQPLDLGIARCRMVVAALAEKRENRGWLRVATKYPRIASTYFARQGIQAEVVFVQGSVELAPIVGLADCIVDLVETGETLSSNGLYEQQEIAQISSVLIANRASYKLKAKAIAPFLEKLRTAL